MFRVALRSDFRDRIDSLAITIPARTIGGIATLGGTWDVVGPLHAIRPYGALGPGGPLPLMNRIRNIDSRMVLALIRGSILRGIGRRI